MTSHFNKLCEQATGDVLHQQVLLIFQVLDQQDGEVWLFPRHPWELVLLQEQYRMQEQAADQ
jgi:hypothetical protein